MRGRLTFSILMRLAGAGLMAAGYVIFSAGRAADKLLVHGMYVDHEAGFVLLTAGLVLLVPWWQPVGLRRPYRRTHLLWMVPLSLCAAAGIELSVVALDGRAGPPLLADHLEWLRLPGYAALTAIMSLAAAQVRRNETELSARPTKRRDGEPPPEVSGPRDAVGPPRRLIRILLASLALSGLGHVAVPGFLLFYAGSADARRTRRPGRRHALVRARDGRGAADARRLARARADRPWTAGPRARRRRDASAGGRVGLRRPAPGLPPGPGDGGASCRCWPSRPAWRRR